MSTTAARAGAATFLVTAVLGIMPVPLVAQAQERMIGTGQTLADRLTADDPRFDDGSHYHIYTVRASAGESLRITLRSEAFDAFLYFGQPAGPDCEQACRADDDGAGGTDSRINAMIVTDGDYQIAVNTLSGGVTGDYTLSVESRTVPLRPARRIDVGDTATGELTDEHPAFDDGSYYEVYHIRAAAGDRLRITLRSDDFDAFLYFGEVGDLSCEHCITDDDGADGTDSVIDTSVEQAGDYMIIVSSFSGDEVGRYTLTVER
jgi:hypothetical protein